MLTSYKTIAFGLKLGLLFCLAQNSFAADWSITQTATIGSTQTKLEQTAASSSYQALNGVRLSDAADGISALTQTATFSNAGNLELTQDGAQADNNVQAVNLAIAETMENVNQSATKATGGTILTQNITAGTGNQQAVNFARANGVINNVTQTFSGADLTVQKSSTTPAGNIQSVNHAQASRYTGNVTQSVDVQTLNYLNRAGNAREIRINSLKGDVAGATVEQTVNVAGTLTVDPATEPTVIINFREQ